MHKAHPKPPSDRLSGGLSRAPARLREFPDHAVLKSLRRLLADRGVTSTSACSEILAVEFGMALPRAQIDRCLRQLATRHDVRNNHIYVLPSPKGATPMTGAPSTTRNVTRNILSSTQRYKLAQWYLDNFDRIRGLRMTKTQAAEAAEATLGFHVTKSNFREVCKMVEKEWPGPRGTGSRTHTNTRIAYVLGHALLDLYCHLGIEAPGDLLHLVHGTDDTNNE